LLKTKGSKKGYSRLIIIFIIIAALLIIIKPLTKRKAEEPPGEQEGREIYKKKPSKQKKPEYKGTEVTKKPEVPESMIAVIIDDVGYPSNHFEEYKSFKGKLTFSVLPFLSKSQKYAKQLHNEGFEVILHIPMEPKGYPEYDPGPVALFIKDTKSEVEKKLQLMLDDLPCVSGANNHMGSMATRDYELMTWTLSYLKNKRLFFIDSVTTTRSCAYELARDLHLKTAKRDIFLDNKDDFAYINSQFEKLKAAAQQNGTAIGIGHLQSSNMIKVLNYQLPLLSKEHCTLIFASEAVRN